MFSFFDVGTACTCIYKNGCVFFFFQYSISTFAKTLSKMLASRAYKKECFQTFQCEVCTGKTQTSINICMIYVVSQRCTQRMFLNYRPSPDFQSRFRAKVHAKVDKPWQESLKMDGVTPTSSTVSIVLSACNVNFVQKS